MKHRTTVSIEREMMGFEPAAQSYVVKVASSDECECCGRGRSVTKCARIYADTPRTEVADRLEQLAHWLRFDKTKTGNKVWSEN